MVDGTQTISPTPPTNGKKSRILLYILGLIVLVLVGEGVIYLRQSGRSGTSIQSVTIPPTISTPPLVNIPTYTPEQAILAKKATTKEISVTESGVDPRELTVGFHDTIIFRNSTQDKIVIEFKQRPTREILPDATWGRSFEEFGEYEYSIKGLENDFLGKIKVAEE